MDKKNKNRENGIISNFLDEIMVGIYRLSRLPRYLIFYSKVSRRSHYN